MGNKNNIIHNFADPVEERQIRHFACKEMGRQIHFYHMIYKTPYNAESLLLE